MEVAKSVVRYIAGQRDACLESRPGNNHMLEVWSDSDWAGAWSVDRECRSRTGVLITHGGMPVDWV